MKKGSGKSQSLQKTPEFKVINSIQTNIKKCQEESCSYIVSKESSVHKWTQEEDKMLLELSHKFGFKSWKRISEFLPGRTHVQCSARYKRIMPGVVKGAWTDQEDATLLSLIEIHGKNWAQISNFLKTRSGKQIRDRYLNALRPGINREKFSEEEDLKILEKFKEIGAKWSQIASILNNRTSDSVKNRFYTSLRKKHFKIDYLRQKRIRQEYLMPGKILEVSNNQPLKILNNEVEVAVNTQDNEIDDKPKSPNVLNKSSKKILFDCIMELNKATYCIDSLNSYSSNECAQLRNKLFCIDQKLSGSYSNFADSNIRKIPLKDKLIIVSEDREKESMKSNHNDRSSIEQLLALTEEKLSILKRYIKVKSEDSDNGNDHSYLKCRTPDDTQSSFTIYRKGD